MQVLNKAGKIKGNISYSHNQQDNIVWTELILKKMHILYNDYIKSYYFYCLLRINRYMCTKKQCDQKILVSILSIKMQSSTKE